MGNTTLPEIHSKFFPKKVNPIAITRDTTDQFTFDITVTINSTVNEKTATDTKVFAVTVPTGIDPVTVVAK